MGVVGVWPHLEGLNSQALERHGKSLTLPIGDLPYALFQAVEMINSPSNPRYRPQGTSVKVLIDGYATFHSLWLKCVRINCQHGAWNAGDPVWRRHRENAIQAARQSFALAVDEELDELYQEYMALNPLDLNFSVECYWDGKSGNTPSAKAEVRAERDRLKAQTAAEAEALLQSMNYGSGLSNVLPTRLIQRFESKCDALFGDPLGQKPYTSWDPIFSSDLGSNFLERGGLEGMTFTPQNSKIRHVLCLNEADLSIARRADYLRVTDNGASISCFVSSDSDLLFLSEPEDLFVRSLNSVGRYQAIDRELLNQLPDWVSAEKQRVLGLVVGQDYTGVGLRNLGLITAIPILNSIPDMGVVRYQSIAYLRRAKWARDREVFDQLLSRIQTDFRINNRVDCRDQAALRRIGEAIRIWSTRAH